MQIWRRAGRALGTQKALRAFATNTYILYQVYNIAYWAGAGLLGLSASAKHIGIYWLAHWGWGYHVTSQQARRPFQALTSSHASIIHTKNTGTNIVSFFSRLTVFFDLPFFRKNGQIPAIYPIDTSIPYLVPYLHIHIHIPMLSIYYRLPILIYANSDSPRVFVRPPAVPDPFRSLIYCNCKQVRSSQRVASRTFSRYGLHVLHVHTVPAPVAQPTA